MEIKDLTASERVTLIALAHACVLADETLSAEEQGGMRKLVQALGEEQYRLAASVARARIQDPESLRAAVIQVTDRAARELIYGTLVELAIPDGISNDEAQLLELLEREWNIQAEPANFPIHDPADPDGDDGPDSAKPLG
jgi:hypothetical protein